MEFKKYFPYVSDRPAKKFYIITNDNKKVYFGQTAYDHFTEGHFIIFCFILHMNRQ